MNSTNSEQVGKVFLALAKDLRQCLVCDGLFTREAGAKHASIPCCPPTKSEHGAAYTDPCSPFLPPIDSSSSPGQA
jgi:hypothetical protein